jgi:hypothetical protein
MQLILKTAVDIASMFIFYRFFLKLFMSNQGAAGQGRRGETSMTSGHKGR